MLIICTHTSPFFCYCHLSQWMKSAIRHTRAVQWGRKAWGSILCALFLFNSIIFPFFSSRLFFHSRDNSRCMLKREFMKNWVVWYYSHDSWLLDISLASSLLFCYPLFTFNLILFQLFYFSRLALDHRGSFRFYFYYLNRRRLTENLCKFIESELK